MEWIQANIFVSEGKQNEVLLTFIKPLVQKLRSEFNITAYHFLREPNNEIRFRVLTPHDKVETIKGLIDNAEKMEQVREVRYPEKPYAGERQAFGEDGWRTTYKFLEAGSDFALDLIDKSVRKGQSFNLIAFSHYLLNQSGLGQIDEASFHASVLVERIVVWTLSRLDDLEKRITQRLIQLENRMKRLEKVSTT